MKRSKLVTFIISALIIAAALAVLPALQLAIAATSVDIVSQDPEDGASGVLADSGRVFTVTFSTEIALSPGYTPYIYWYDGDPGHTWADSSAPCTNIVKGGPGGNVLSFELPTSFADGLPTDTAFGIMLPGPDNVYGDNTGFIESVESPGVLFAGIDFPSTYISIDGGAAGCWTFRTAGSYDPPSVQSMLPVSGSTEVDPNSEIHLYFDQPVSLNTGTHYVKIMDSNLHILIRQIPSADLVIPGGASSDVTIPPQGLAYNRKYYINISAGTFIGEWSGLPGDGLSDENLYFTTETAYMLTYTPGEHGYIESGGTSYFSAFSRQIVAGESGPEVIAVADEHYHFVQWSDGEINASRTDTNVQGNINVTAEFVIDTYTLDYAAGVNGTLTVDGTAGLSDYQEAADYMESGTEVTAVPDEGYHFVKWSDDVLTASRTDTNVQGDINVTAEFAINTYTLDYTAEEGGTLTVGGTAGLPDYQQTVDHMASGTEVTAVPDTGYLFIGWSDGVTDTARTDADVQEDIEVTAMFVRDSYNLEYTAGANGTLTVGGTAGLPLYQQVVSYLGSGPEVIAVPDTGYLFVRWSDGLTSAARADANVDDDITVTAEFAADMCTIEYLSGGNGTIEGVAEQNVPYGGNGTQVTATPASGYHFVQWSDGVTSAARTDTAITEDMSVTAIFEINTYTLRYSAGEHGSLTGNLDQSVQYGGSGTQVIASPDEHYHLAKWSDGVVTSYRTDKNVAGDINVTAVFAINKYKVTFEDHDGTILKTQHVAYGSDAAPPEDPEREGYEFSGWDGDYYDITAATVITAEYEINSYKVTFADCDGTELKTQSVIYGLGAAPPADPVREGYTFTGWDGDYTKITGAVTFTAQYEADTCKVTFADYDGSVIDTQEVESGRDAAAPDDPERQGYVFTGWDKEFTGVTEDITVTAQYRAALKVTKAGTQNGNRAVIVETGGLEVTEAAVEGGKATVNEDGTITLEFPNGVKAGDVEVALKLSDGTTVSETITITDEAVAEMAPDERTPGPPLWIWIGLGALAVVAAALMIIFVRRMRRARY